MEKPIASLPLCYDIANFEELDGYVASREIGNLLQQKGFCFIRGSADEASKKLAEQEDLVLVLLALVDTLNYSVNWLTLLELSINRAGMSRHGTA
ncbi:unnamed protein product [Polarella glacialis]|uniref:Uncharacterized protein n=1 Tax=Polarella glacialis TaxID=89957 RepID=A0A813LFT7_POLGL|nr:unnamed protein product [Polarella glacialis]